MPQEVPSLGQFVQRGFAPPAQLGLFDGLDPALSDDIFDPRQAVVLENFRVGRGEWETRDGSTLWRNIGGSGVVHFLGRVIDGSGNRYTLSARGGTLYDYQEDGGDVAFQAVSGGTGLSTSRPLQGVQLGGRFYFTDRSGALRAYVIAGSSSVAAVALPTAPGEPVRLRR